MYLLNLFNGFNALFSLLDYPILELQGRLLPPLVLWKICFSIPVHPQYQHHHLFDIVAQPLDLQE